MPYIDLERRKHIKIDIDMTVDGKPLTPGDLNYIFTKIITNYLRMKRHLGKVGYAEMSVIRGVLADVSEEFYRRVMAPYEDQKMAATGDV